MWLIMLIIHVDCDTLMWLIMLIIHVDLCTLMWFIMLIIDNTCSLSCCVYLDVVYHVNNTCGLCIPSCGLSC